MTRDTIASMIHRFTKAHLPLMIQFILISLCLVYILIRGFSQSLAPPITLQLSLFSDTCATATASLDTSDLFTGAKKVTVPLTLSPKISEHFLPIQPSTQTVFIEPCQAGTFTLTSLSLSSIKGSVYYALEPGDLHCYSCQLIKLPDTSLLIKPTAPEPQLVIGNVDNKARYLLPVVFRPERYLPHLIFALLLLAFLWPFLDSVTAVAVTLQGGLIFIYGVFKWSSLLSLFPPPLIGPQKIVGYAQMIGLPLTADTLIFNLVLVSLPLLVVCHWVCRRLHFSLSNTLLITSALVGCLIYVLETNI